MYNLFLDDFRTPEVASKYMLARGVAPTLYTENDWIVVKNYNEFVNHIEKNGLPDLISFDHDLSDEHYDPSMYKGAAAYAEAEKRFTEKTGYHCAQWLIEYCIDNKQYIPDFIVHSMNPVGTKNIQELLDSAIKNQNNWLE